MDDGLILPETASGAEVLSSDRIESLLEKYKTLEEAVAEERVPDETFLQPLRWISGNLAWLGGVSIVVLVSMKIAWAAHFSVIGIDVLVQNSSVQEITIDMMPTFLSVGIILLVMYTSVRAVKSQSEFAIPVFVSTCIIALLVIAVYTPLPDLGGLFLNEVLLIPMIISARKYQKKIRASEQFEKSSKILHRKLVKLLKATKSFSVDQEVLAALDEAASSDELYKGSFISNKRFNLERERLKIIMRTEALEKDNEAFMVRLQSFRSEYVKEQSTEPDSKIRIRAHRDEHSKVHSWKKKRPGFIIVFVLLVLITNLAALLSSPFWIPSQEFVPYGSAKFSGYELSNVNGELTVMATNNRKILQFESSKLRQNYLCQIANSPSTYSVVRLIVNRVDPQHYPECVN